MGDWFWWMDGGRGAGPVLAMGGLYKSFVRRSRGGPRGEGDVRCMFGLVRRVVSVAGAGAGWLSWHGSKSEYATMHFTCCGLLSSV